MSDIATETLRIAATSSALERDTSAVQTRDTYATTGMGLLAHYSMTVTSSFLFSYDSPGDRDKRQREMEYYET